MTSNETRRFPSALSAVRGVAGMLTVQKCSPGAEGADLAPGTALKWPKCDCGNPVCPDYEAPVGTPANSAATPALTPVIDELTDKVREINRRSREGLL